MQIKRRHFVWFTLIIMVMSICGLCGIVWLRYIEPLSEPAGKGAKAEAGYQSAAPINKALERYYTDKGHYPASLQMLVPDYLDKIPKIPNSSYDWDYQVKDTNYQLIFRYVGPCFNQCTYSSDQKKWTCGGAC